MSSYFGAAIWTILNKTFGDVNYSISTISSIHRRIHLGDKYIASHDFGSVSRDDNADVLLQNPSGSIPHLTKKFFNTEIEQAKIYFYEDPTFSDSGEGLETGVQNLKRTEGAGNVQPTVNPTIDDEGTLLDIQSIAGTKVSGPSRGVDHIEWILKPSTDYLIRFTNESDSSTDICVINLSWYEEEPISS